ncbi:hypothetical protein M758_8G058000 [Ceratodon purpureus]|nr:hypothetical protein M758_8G058000 [Ceratodon purpureus]
MTLSFNPHILAYDAICSSSCYEAYGFVHLSSHLYGKNEKAYFNFVQMRTDAYRDAIVSNPTLLKDTVVMDVGYGTGILRYISVIFLSLSPSLLEILFESF